MNHRKGDSVRKVYSSELELLTGNCEIILAKTFSPFCSKRQSHPVSNLSYKNYQFKLTEVYLETLYL